MLTLFYKFEIIAVLAMFQENGRLAITVIVKCTICGNFVLRIWAICESNNVNYINSISFFKSGVRYTGTRLSAAPLSAVKCGTQAVIGTAAELSAIRTFYRWRLFRDFFFPGLISVVFSHKFDNQV